MSHFIISKTLGKLINPQYLTFLEKVSWESWDTIFKSEDANDMFNSSLNTYLRIFYSSFPIEKVISRKKNENNS
jgi:hypothetical protein